MITGKTSSNGLRFAHGTGDRAELVRMLTHAYWMEVETVMNYIAASTNPDGVRARQVADSLRAEIPDELAHAQALAARINELHGAVPGSSDFSALQQSLQPPADPSDIVSVITGVIDAEKAAIEHYGHIAEAAEGTDWVTHDLAVQLLRDEEAHRRLFESYLVEMQQADCGCE